MSEPIRLFLACGEPSGDILAAELVKALRGLTDRPVDLLGVGGANLEALGLESLFPMEELTVMGLAEVLPRIPNLLKRIGQTAEAAIALKPDMVLSVDSPDFGFRVQKRIARRAPDLTRVHFVAPTVWAWRQGRAKAMADYLDAVLTLLPFEPAFFETVGLKAIHVGHPVVDRGRDFKQLAPHFRADRGIGSDQPVLVILPGSRRGEIKRHMPVFGEAVAQLAKQNPDLAFVLPTLPHLKPALEEALASWPVKVHLTIDEAGKWSAFHAGTAALAASGTVSLELTVARCPTVVAYKVNPLTAMVLRRMLKIDYASITNLILNEEVLPEFIQENFTAANLVEAVSGLLNDDALRAKQLDRIGEALEALGEGGPSPAERAAQAVLEMIDHKKGA